MQKKPEALCSGFFCPENHESRAFAHKTNVFGIACLNRINLLPYSCAGNIFAGNRRVNYDSK
ncbi:hypothetical protein MUY_002464 [Bacillus licheniformis WX-02]|nr:hypothetical protein MUY_002464 [Bacillus licheniformis WX-02]RCK11580.1 hypothetical protein DT075_19010 [Bacillus licheniformis]